MLTCKQKILISILASVVSGYSFADIVLDEDFELTPLASEWSVINGVFNHAQGGGSQVLRSDSGNSYGTVINTATSGGGYTISARIKQWNKDSQGGIVFRYNEADGSFYKLSTDHGAADPSFFRLDYFDGSNFQTLAETQIDANVLQFSDLKIIAFKNTFDCYLDGQLLFSHTESDPAFINSEGLVGFNGGGVSAIDNLLVDDDISGSSILLVEEDFNDGNITDGIPNTWTIESGSYVTSQTAFGLSLKSTMSTEPLKAVTGDYGLDDYRIGAHLLGNLGLSKPGVIGRYQPDGSYYQAHIERNTNDLVTSFYDGSSFIELSRLDVKDNLFKDDVSTGWHYVELDFQAESISVYYDGTLADTIVDTTNLDGKPGLSGFTNSFFDNVLVASSGASFAPPSESACSGEAIRAPSHTYWTDSSLGLDLRLDILHPAEGENCPVIVYLHGGGWQGSHVMGTRALNFAGRQADRGFAVISIEYRTSDEAIFPAQIYDVKNALRYIRANEATLIPNGLDASTIVAFGLSAGAHLSLLANTSGEVTALEDLSQGNSAESSSLQGAVGCYPPIDFDQMVPQLEQLFPGQNHTNDEPDSDVSIMLGCNGVNGQPNGLNDPLCNSEQADPTFYLDSLDPPVLIGHGTSDQVVPYLQSENFHNTAMGIGINSTLEIFAGGNHLPDQSCPDDSTIDEFVDSIFFGNSQ